MADGGGDVTSVFWAGRAALGEGPLWDARIGTLYWADIVAGTVSAFAAGAGRPVEIELGVQVGCLGLTEDPHTLIAGLRTGWHLLDVRSGRVTATCSAR